MKSRTLPWSKSVQQVWTLKDGTGYVEIVGDHTFAELALVRSPDGGEEWIPYAVLHEKFEQACCESCGKPLEVMSWLLLQESKRNAE